jgi:hypothetical protein
MFMDKASPEAVRLGSGLGILALLLPAWMAIYVPLKDKRKSLLEARNEVLEPLKRDPLDAAPPLTWLLPRWSRSMVYGRQSVDKKLDSWLDTSKAIMIIDGGPLVGKTRMAQNAVTLSANSTAKGGESQCLSWWIVSFFVLAWRRSLIGNLLGENFHEVPLGHVHRGSWSSFVLRFRAGHGST